jgi:MFS family permease
VLTSYITASAIMTAPVGWLAARYGRKPLYVGCIFGFAITSMLCGAAQSLGQMVVFRILQPAADSRAHYWPEHRISSPIATRSRESTRFARRPVIMVVTRLPNPRGAMISPAVSTG